MNIKEIEQRSGLTRANIRYYEQEGLLRPARQENKYRDYSDEDLETLLRIALLRSPTPCALAATRSVRRDSVCSLRKVSATPYRVR